MPSKVEGVTGVAEVAVFPDRLEMRGDRGWVTVPFGSFAERGRVARNYFSRERYADSHIRFLTDPPVSIYMPADGPTQFPDSVFWRIQLVIASGGYRVSDGDDPPPKPNVLDALPGPVRRFVYGFVGMAVLNFLLFCAISVCIGGSAWSGKVEDGRYFLSMNGRLTEVSHGVWTYSRYHEFTMLVLWVSMFVVLGVAHVYADACRRQKQDAPAGVSAPPP
jgi:hypothetical protein